ncbi:MAG: stage III sporulation protein AA [Clostridia bacterium]|nr:stage III sporulation protein AA [Clostridia bacterium]
MLTLAKEELISGQDLFSAVPERIRKYLCGVPADKLMEIRLRSGVSLSLVCTDGIFYITHKGRLTENYREAVTVTGNDIRRGLELVTRSSVYAFENEIKNGYVTLAGGHRVGISGDAVIDEGKISHIRSVQSLNYRFAREVIGAADCVIDRIFDGKKIKNTLIVSPPMCGKTTMLRDIARQLSQRGKKVSIVDERGEIAALSFGASPFELGANCDVLANVNKADGMLLMLRAMSPDVIITDEIGDERDFAAISEIKKRGVSVITTLHGMDFAEGGFEEIIRICGVGQCLS